jgi:hypothetical protein
MTAGGLARSRRITGVIAATMTVGVLIAGCAEKGSDQAASSSAPSSSGTSSSSSASAGAAQSPLSKGLLPAAAFGGNATVASMTVEQFQQQTSGQLGTATDLQVQPPQCRDALKSTQIDAGQIKELVAQTATTEGASGQASVTVEAIATGDATTGAVDELKSTLANCSKVTATSAQLGQVSVQFSAVDVSGVGTQAAAVSYTTTITPPGRAPVSVPVLLGEVKDGTRLVLLLTANANGANVNGSGGPAPAAPDPSAFTALFKKAYSTEHQQLG